MCGGRMIREVSMEEPASKLRIKESFIGGDSEYLARETAHLLTLDKEALRRRWETLFGGEPSPNFGRQFMLRAITYRLQEKTLGGLKPSVRRILDRNCDAAPDVAIERMATARPGAGTVLVREWRGARHRVTVLDNDVVYRGQRYKSLSEVARIITGTRWSGPLFFGLKGRAQNVANG